MISASHALPVNAAYREISCEAAGVGLASYILTGLTGLIPRSVIPPTCNLGVHRRKTRLLEAIAVRLSFGAMTPSFIVTPSYLWGLYLLFGGDHGSHEI